MFGQIERDRVRERKRGIKRRKDALARMKD
jgi:hypothetical protein